ncbi:cyclin-dependent kinase 9-like [Contarinia nasturtii]|uniref:cyclin-dependent kinase 9-like n=1 Tax=Contarinia nasturtii TaxID=265458 RepID=UPI0012D4225E|nr:cyclin-dependent kinase 9-like [Contarinia nasturtii]
MATRSIFDCDAQNELEREQVTYDDDLFDFGLEIPADERVVIPKNVSISETISQNGADNEKRGKRKAHNVPEFRGNNHFKSAKLNVPTIKATANDVPRGRVEFQKKCDEYELLHKIGKGTYGDVYKARYSTGQIIAIKRILCPLDIPNMEKNMAFVKREYDHLREMQECNNIVKLLKGREDQISEKEIQLDLLFEYCPYDLQKIILNTRIHFQFSEIKAFLRQMFLGLEYMHSKMLMHRDFKTENILLTADGIVKIADFGLSRKLSDPNSTLEKHKYTPNVVTQWYRAPEILLGDRYYNESVDIWAIGCVMGEFWNRGPILKGHNEINQIKLISKLCGSMTAKDWPKIVNLHLYQQIEHLPNDKRTTRTYLIEKPPRLAHNQANDLFDKLLRCNPEKRLTACRALNDSFFFESPLPAKNLKKFMMRILPFLNSSIAAPKTVEINPAFDYVY